MVSPRRPVACSLSDNDVGCNTLLPSAADFPPSLPADLMPLVAVVCELRELALASRQANSKHENADILDEFSFITHNRLRLSLHSSSLVRSTRR